MSDYIRKQDILAECDKAWNAADENTTVGVAIINIIDKFTDYIESLPTADVQPVKHGYWEEVTDYGGWGDTHYRCSVCGEEWYLEDGKPKDNNMNFCPRCGAKMDAKPDEPWQSD